MLISILCKKWDTPKKFVRNFLVKKLEKEYGQIEIEVICLTDLWKATGLKANRDPRQWKRKLGQQFIDSVVEKLNVSIYQSARGKNGGTHAHWQIALAYAKYL